MPHRLGLVAFVAFALLARPAFGQSNNPSCTINTGLDPACPLTAAGVDLSTQTVSANASEHTATLFGSWTWHDGAQLTLTAPVYMHLGIANVGDAYGTGDLELGFTQAFGGKKRLTQVAGLSSTLATGATAFSNGATQLAPLYGLSYALGGRVSLVATGQYWFDVGGTKLPFAPRTQTLAIVPRAIVDLSRSGLYAAANLQGDDVTGNLRYQAYQAGATLGFARRHANLAVDVGYPITTYTREHIFYRSIGLQASWQHL